jgi:glutathione S-transferase
VTLRLITIGFSHYCEKARWALDRGGLAYREESHAPILHMPPAMLAGRSRATPILVDTDAGRAWTDSSDILLEVDRRSPGTGLFPSDPAQRTATLELEDELDRDLGPATRRIAYYHLLRGGEPYARELLGSAAAPGTRFAVLTAYPLLARAIARALRIDEEGFQRSMAKLESVFERVSARLEMAEAEGRSWLVGDTFTAADLTFAALAGPVLGPAEAGFNFPPRGLLPPELLRLAERLAATRAGAHALRTYQKERRRNLIGA